MPLRTPPPRSPTLSPDAPHALTAPDAANRLRLPDDVQLQLLQVAHHKQLQRGDSLFLKGSAPDALFGVVSGSLVYTSTSWRSSARRWSCTPMGMMSVLPPQVGTGSLGS